MATERGGCRRNDRAASRLLEFADALLDSRARSAAWSWADGSDAMTWALVTGASARGGAAISRSLHAAGVDVVMHHSARSVEKARVLQSELCGARRDSARLWEAELSAQVEVPRWLVELAPRHCVCNASVYRSSDIADAVRAHEDWAIHVGAHAAILAALRPALISVTGVSDIHVERPAPGYVWYTVAKAGLQALLLALAVEWAPAVRCNVVAPGTLPFPADWSDGARKSAIEASIPLARVGDFAELAAAVKWLTLDATYVTGQVLAVDGGRSRRLV